MGETYVKTEEDFIDKMHKAEYVELQYKLTEELTTLAEKLKTISDKEPERQ